MSENAPTIRVNFGKPMALFPLGEAVLLPHAVVPLHIFEPRYRQMIEQALDGPGQIAMAVFEGERWRQEYHGAPPLRPAVCVGQIIQHERLPDGRFNVLLQGVCRARIEDELPTDDTQLFRRAVLRPVGVDEEDEPRLAPSRAGLLEALRSPALRRFGDAQGNSLAEALAAYVERPPAEIPTPVVVDLVAHLLAKDPELKYALLAEPDAEERAAMVIRELRHLDWLLRRGDLQVDPKAPKGVFWN